MAEKPQNARTNKRGAFIGGIWYCGCEPRMPADKFQTKNGGKNHGRWFYTCQKAQPKRCGFFLWTDDAKIREESAILSNSTSEPEHKTAPQTPRKIDTGFQPPTPMSRPGLGSGFIPRKTTASTSAHSGNDLEHEESFEWPSSGDDGNAAAVTNGAAPAPYQTPRKAQRTTFDDSPTKRLRADETNEDVFVTPRTSKTLGEAVSPGSGIKPPAYVGTLAGQRPALTDDVLEILKPVNVPSDIQERLIELLTKFELRTQGIMKGRDITRVAVQTKERKIAELQARIAVLEAERETSRTVISCLKKDIATSPKRPRRPQPPA